MTEDMAEILRRHRLRWLGHVARMDNNRLPKQLLFGELVRPRPRHGTKKRWRDVARADLQVREIEEKWYEMAQDRKMWSRICKQCNDFESRVCRPSQANPDQSNPSSAYPCRCGRHFRRKGDLTRHQKFCDGSQQLQSRTQPVSTYMNAHAEGPSVGKETSPDIPASVLTISTDHFILWIPLSSSDGRLKAKG